MVGIKAFMEFRGDHKEALARELKIEKNIKLHGWLDRIDVHLKLRTCDFAALPGIRELAEALVIESIALRLPAIVADYGGPAELVDLQQAFASHSSTKPA